MSTWSTFGISDENGQTVPARRYPAALQEAEHGRPQPVARLILAHGAGAGQATPFMLGMAEGLGALGIEVVTFDFPYITSGRRVPDRAEVLERCYRTVVEHAGGSNTGPPLFIGGKSMGGRIASQLMARPDAPSDLVRGLVFLGYPLHPPAAPQKLRTAHWPAIAAPMLFVQGTRDTFGTVDEIRSQLEAAGIAATVLAVQDADHSLKVRRAGVSPKDVVRRVQVAIADWMRDPVGSTPQSDPDNRLLTVFRSPTKR